MKKAKDYLGSIHEGIRMHFLVSSKGQTDVLKAGSIGQCTKALKEEMKQDDTAEYAIVYGELSHAVAVSNLLKNR